MVRRIVVHSSLLKSLLVLRTVRSLRVFQSCLSLRVFLSLNMSKKIQLSRKMIIGFLIGFVLACFLLKASLFIVLFFRIKDNGLVNENIKMGYRYETYSLCPKCCLDGDDFLFI